MGRTQILLLTDKRDGLARLLVPETHLQHLCTIEIVQDQGDVTLQTGVSPDDADVTMEEAVAQMLAGGQAPLLMGGDHSVTFPAMRAITAHCRTALHPERLRELPIAIVHFDAHPVRRRRYLWRVPNCTPSTPPSLMVTAFAISL